MFNLFTKEKKSIFETCIDILENGKSNLNYTKFCNKEVSIEIMNNQWFYHDKVSKFPLKFNLTNKEFKTIEKLILNKKEESYINKWL